MKAALLLSSLLWALSPSLLLAQASPQSAQGSAAAEERQERININEAGVEELVRLPGIGPTRARAIIEERSKRKFRRIEDILRVRGIGRKTFRRLRDSIRVR